MPAPLYLLAGAGLTLARNAFQAPERRQRMRESQADFEFAKRQYMSQDLSNPMLGLENAYEDLTVNTLEADFIREQQDQNLADTMDTLRSSAGGSGISSLAQSMLNVQNQNAIQNAARIGGQEARNNMLRAQGAMTNQMSERQGEMYSRGLKRNQFATEYGIAQNDLQSAIAERNAAINSNFQAFGTGIGGGLDYMSNINAATGQDFGLGLGMIGLLDGQLAKTGGGFMSTREPLERE